MYPCGSGRVGLGILCGGVLVSPMTRPAPERHPILRAALRAIGLSEDRVSQVIQFIVELLDEVPGGTEAGRDLGAFRLRDDFLSPAEKSFFRVLRGVVGSEGEVLAKIRLGDLFYPSRGDYGDRVSLRNRVDRKHVDFLVCRPDTFEPWFGLELDDASHRRPERVERDELVNQVFAAAGLPLVRIPAKAGYATAEVGRLLREKAGFRGQMAQAPATPSDPARGPGASIEDAPRARDPQRVPVPPAMGTLSPTQDAPACPKCGSVMVPRTARNGSKAGTSFWGCPNYPNCRGIVGGPAAR